MNEGYSGKVMKGVIQLVIFKEIVIEKGRRIAELSGRYFEVLLNF